MIVTGRWSKDRYIALCDDDRCAWKYVTERYTQVMNKADEHVQNTRHSVTIHREAKCHVGAGVLV